MKTVSRKPMCVLLVLCICWIFYHLHYAVTNKSIFIDLFHSKRNVHFSSEPTDENQAIKKFFTFSSSFSLEPRLDISSNHNFVIYIMSAIDEIELRKSIRSTWCNLDNVRRFSKHKFNVQRMFVVGGLRFVPEALQQDLQKEQLQNHDLLSVDNLKDAYNNLTEKTIYALHYINSKFQLPTLDFIFKVDSDNFINIFKFLAKAWEYQMSGSVPDFICMRRGKTPVLRDGKYQETATRFTQDTYPEYCSGPAYVSSGAVIPRLMTSSVTVPILQSEDVMLTGIGLLATGHVSAHNITRRDAFFNRQQWERKSDSIIRIMPQKYFAHELTVDMWPQVYKTLVEHNL